MCGVIVPIKRKVCGVIVKWGREGANRFQIWWYLKGREGKGKGGGGGALFGGTSYLLCELVEKH